MAAEDDVDPEGGVLDVERDPSSVAGQGERYRRIARHRGKKKAIVAVGRSSLFIIWHLPDRGSRRPTPARLRSAGKPSPPYSQSIFERGATARSASGSARRAVPSLPTVAQMSL